MPIPHEVNRLARTVLDAAFKVHSILGPGLLESVYQACLVHELLSRKIAVETQVAFPVVYEGHRIEMGLRLDLVIARQVIIELKAVEALHPVHTAQLLTYLKLTGIRLGLLINFNTVHLKDGIRRLVL